MTEPEKPFAEKSACHPECQSPSCPGCAEDSDEAARVSVAKFPVATVIEISIIGVYPASLYPTLQTEIEKFQAELQRKFVDFGGRDAHPRWAEVRQATKEEVLHFTPRKIHYSRDGKMHVCDTVHVSKRNLTRNIEEVTCKLCKRKLGITGD
jgi:hypothetical protein